MKLSETIMGEAAVVEIADEKSSAREAEDALEYFRQIDSQFSLYKKDSEMTKINKGLLDKKDASPEMRKILRLCEETRIVTKGYFNILYQDVIDPSGLVKGYAINESSKMLQKKGFRNFYIGIGGDIDIRGKKNGLKWKIGIQNPFNTDEILKVIYLSDCGIATSGNYIRGNLVYDPVHRKKVMSVAGITVIGPNIYEADRWATAAFAMGEKGIEFIEAIDSLEGYMITKEKKAIQTSGFDKFL